MYFNFENTAIHYKVNGKGKAVVLLHGFLESTDMWEDYAKELTNKYKVILIDLPGHGQSGFFSNETTIDRMALMVKALIDHLGLLKIQMVGHSMGGYVSLAFAVLFPEKLESFTLLHSTAYADSEEVMAKRDLAVEMLKSHPKLYIKKTITGLFRAETRKNFKFDLERLIKSALKVNPKGYIRAVESMKNRPDRTLLLQSDIPICFIAGKYDPVISEDSSKTQIESLKNGSGMFLKHAGHMGFIEEKETGFQLMAQFLNMDKS